MVKYVVEYLADNGEKKSFPFDHEEKWPVSFETLLLECTMRGIVAARITRIYIQNDNKTQTRVL